jgi:asparagine synthase (glutamine-hydrolysing)
MCGILCVLQTGERSAENRRALRERVLQRAARLRHRGPDWSGVRASDDAVLAHERLAIVDPASGTQPLHNQDKSVWLAANGEIWNHAALYRDLVEPAALLTKSDCECLIHLYEAAKDREGGIRTMLNQVRGMFAFVLADERTKRYVVARDHIGIVPCFW